RLRLLGSSLSVLHEIWPKTLAQSVFELRDRHEIRPAAPLEDRGDRLDRYSCLLGHVGQAVQPNRVPELVRQLPGITCRDRNRLVVQERAFEVVAGYATDDALGRFLTVHPASFSPAARQASHPSNRCSSLVSLSKPSVILSRPTREAPLATRGSFQAPSISPGEKSVLSRLPHLELLGKRPIEWCK